MGNTRIIKCSNCGIFNNDNEYCKNCNTLLVKHKKKKEARAKHIKEQAVKQAILEKENPNFVERLKKHPFFLYRFFGWILYSAVMVVSAIGAGLAWFITMVAAG